MAGPTLGFLLGLCVSSCSDLVLLLEVTLVTQRIHEIQGSQYVVVLPLYPFLVIL